LRIEKEEKKNKEIEKDKVLKEVSLSPYNQNKTFSVLDCIKGSLISFMSKKNDQSIFGSGH